VTPTDFESSPERGSAKGLRQFLDLEQQRRWMEGETTLSDAAERSESLEQRFKYVARFEKLLRRPQVQEVLELLRLYGENCLPIPQDRASLLVGFLSAVDLRQAAQRLTMADPLHRRPRCS
jgi:hypothetical protein